MADEVNRQRDTELVEVNVTTDIRLPADVVRDGYRHYRLSSQPCPRRASPSRFRKSPKRRRTPTRCSERAGDSQAVMRPEQQKRPRRRGGSRTRAAAGAAVFDDDRLTMPDAVEQRAQAALGFRGAGAFIVHNSHFVRGDSGRTMSRSLVNFVAVVCSVASMSAQNRNAAAAPHPDLQGNWMNTFATPLERPRELADTPLLSDQQVSTLNKGVRAATENGGVMVVPSGQSLLTLLEDPSKIAPNPNYDAGFFTSFEFENRTSLITDPPNGRLPAYT